MWLIDVTFADGSAGIHAESRGERMRIGEIDPRCDRGNERTAQADAAASRGADLDAGCRDLGGDQETLGRAPGDGDDYRHADESRAVSRGRVTIQTSKDPVGAPIFYRDVPLMPSELEKGVIKPLAASAVAADCLAAAQRRRAPQPAADGGLHTCANCHSFSRDGKTLGMDLDGPQNDKGMYAIVPIAPQMSIRNEDVITWSSFRGKPGRQVRVGFMSQVSPDGQLS